MWFSENQIPPSMAKSSETDLKKKTYLKQKHDTSYTSVAPQIMTPVAKNKKVDSNIKIEVKALILIF